jgi:tRNA pseudouridine38-40 synthase
VNSDSLYAAGLVAYDGTDFHGYQYQIGVATVQGTLESSLAAFCQPVGRVAAAGRTDAGVHANGQVISALVRWRHGAEQLQRAWNAHLPGSICVRQMRPAPKSFHPRFSALWRTYRYRLIQPMAGYDRMPAKSPLTDRFAWFVPRPLDLDDMQEACAYLIGDHDFATFGQPTQGESTVRRVKDAGWLVDGGTAPELDEFPGRRLVFTITANGFLRQMVRTLTATLVEIGLGKRRPQEMERLLGQRDRGLAAAPAPGSGLTLEQVQYPTGQGFE